MLVFHLDDSHHEDCLVIVVSISEHETRTEFGVYFIFFFIIIFFGSVVWFTNMPFCFWSRIIVSAKSAAAYYVV